MVRSLLFLAVGTVCGITATAAPARAEGNLKFQIFADKANAYRWRLRAANGEILATSGQGYKAKTSARSGVDHLRKDLESLEFVVYEDARKETRWRLRAKNGQVVASSSEGYKSKTDAEHAIDVVKGGVADASVTDDT